MGRVNIGPGPGKYKLPPLVGYPNHDVSKNRKPQWSMGNRLEDLTKNIGPGPTYNTEHMTMYGKAHPPAYSLISRHKSLTMFQGPGPAAYGIQNLPRFKEPRPPAFSIADRHPWRQHFVTPAPNIYDVPTTLGPKVPDKPTAGAFSMSSKHAVIDKRLSPGPAKYSPAPLNNFKNRLPQYSLRPLHADLEKSRSPGPMRYYPKLGRSGGYSFGLRTDNSPYITPDDAMPCINK